eukprot:6380940-Pyramimonas_sp.AAC.1
MASSRRGCMRCKPNSRRRARVTPLGSRRWRRTSRRSRGSCWRRRSVHAASLRLTGTRRGIYRFPWPDWTAPRYIPLLLA